MVLIYFQVERYVKFCQTDTRKAGNGGKKPDTAGDKNRSKSSTLSLHTMAGPEGDSKEEPALQRRNSIHNVPFVDVNDPDTRTRMERYKEERRSMLRAKYKAEDYLSSSFSRKKKTSSSQDSSESDLTPDHDTGDNDVSIESGNTSPVSDSPAAPPSYDSTAYVPQVNNEMIIKQQCNNEMFYKSEVAVASVQKKISLNREERPADLKLSDSNKDQVSTQSSKTPEEDNVNVKERASIFGPRKVSETKVRTVSAPVSTNQKSSSQRSDSVKKLSVSSPSKIKNMAAMFEQRQ